MAENEAPQESGNVFTRKIGPMPMWAWVAIISAALIGYAFYKNKQSSAASTSATSPDTTPPQIDQFQLNMPPVQTTVTPPAPGEGKEDEPQVTNIWADAKAALERKGVKNPTKKQIEEERAAILRAAGRIGKTPVTQHNRHKPTVHKPPSRSGRGVKAA